MPIIQAEVDFSADVFETAERSGATEDLPKVVRFTHNLFGVTPGVRVAIDPEIPDWVHLVVEVDVSGTLDEVAEKDRRWHRQIADVARSAPDLFCLSISYRSVHDR